MHKRKLCVYIFINIAIHCCAMSSAEEVTIVSPDVEVGDRVGSINKINIPSHQQYLHNASNFSALPEGGAFLKGYSVRLDENWPTANSYIGQDFQLRVSTTSIESLSTFYEDNMGEDVELVFAGDFVFETPKQGPPWDFSLPVMFDEPIMYDPSEGNLLVDLTFGKGFDTLIQVDFQSTPGFTTAVAGDVGEDIASLSGEAVLVKQFIFELPLPFDFNFDGALGMADLNLLLSVVADGGQDSRYDVNGDATVDFNDVEIFVTDKSKLNTWIGDSNLDGEFNSGDFVNVFQAGKFEKDVDASWQEGDWSGDLRFTSLDFVKAFQDGGYELGPRQTVSSVPEPTSLSLLVPVMIGIAIRRRILERNE